jgi:DNA mismatch repair protein MutS2
VLSDEGRELMERLRRARDELREAQTRLRAKKSEPQAVREAALAIERVVGEVAIGGPLEPVVAPVDLTDRPPVRSPDLRKGLRVWVPRLRAEAEVVELLPGGDVRVAAGALKMTVPAADLRAIPPPEAAPARSARPTGGRGTAAPGPVLQRRDNTCDLRGLRVDDGLALTATFLDRALNEGMDVVFLLHGHGTGALRDAVRKELTSSPYVARFAPAPPEQGGDGVTIVWLA